MNEELLQLYAGISDPIKAQTLQHFKQSPRILHYLQLLEKGIRTTPKLVAQIYAAELPNTELAQLTNRFYKLRSRVHVWLLQQMQYNQSTQIPEQQELTFFKLLVAKNEHLYVLPRLQSLMKRCWALNLFELLPEVIELTIKAGYACEALTVEENKVLYEQLEEASQLLYTFHQVHAVFYYLYRNVDDYTSRINTIRRLIKNYKAYPRLELLYRYIAFCIGVHRKDLVDRTSGALMRHLNAFYNLKKQYPDMPIRTLEPFHQEKTSAFFYDKEAVFWYHKEQLKKCILALKKRQAIIQQSPNLIHDVSSQSLHNAIYFCTYAKDYDTALAYVRELEHYQDNNPGKALEAPYSIYEMVIYISDYPNRKHPNPIQLIEEVRYFLDEKAPPQSAWISMTLIEFALLYEYYKVALSYLNHPYYLQYLKRYDSYQVYTTELVQAVVAEDQTGLLEIINALKNELATNPEGKLHFHYETTLMIAQYCIRRILQQ